MTAHNAGMTAELNRQLENLLRLGAIHSVDHDGHKVRVASGALVTDWLPWPAEVARNYTRWRPLKPGIPVLLGCISGDPAQAVILQVLHSEDFPAISANPDLDIIRFNNGTQIVHNIATGDLSCSAPGNVTLSAGKTLTLSANKHRIKGPVEQTGGDMTSDGVSAQHHPHGGVKAGIDESGEPKKGGGL